MYHIPGWAHTKLQYTAINVYSTRNETPTQKKQTNPQHLALIVVCEQKDNTRIYSVKVAVAIGLSWFYRLTSLLVTVTSLSLFSSCHFIRRILDRKPAPVR